MTSENGKFVVRQAIKTDMTEVVSMIQELADFEKMSDGPKLTAKDLIRDAFDLNPPLFRCKVAESTNHESTDPSDLILGYTIYFSTYSTWEGQAMMLEDIYVREKHRGKGVASKLFSAVAAEATSRGCSRLDFHVLRWNPAREFYKRRGAADLTEAEGWCYYRLSGESLRVQGLLQK